MKVPPDIVSELADVKGWAGERAVGTAFTLLDYVMCVGTPDLLFGFAELLSPELIVHEGLHCLASGFSAGTYGEWKRQGLSDEEIQRVMNHIHMSAIFQEQDISDRMAVAAAQCIARSWQRSFGVNGIDAVAVGTTFADAAVTLFDVKRAS